MPEVTAITPNPAKPEQIKPEQELKAKIELTDNRLPKLHREVAGELQQAGVNVSELTVNPAPHIPNFSNEAKVDEEAVHASESEPGSYRKMELPGMPDIVRQHATGDTTVIGNSGDLNEKKEGMETAKRTFLSKGQQSGKKPRKNPLDWFYDEDEKAA